MNKSLKIQEEFQSSCPCTLEQSPQSISYKWTAPRPFRHAEDRSAFTQLTPPPPFSLVVFFQTLPACSSEQGVTDSVMQMGVLGKNSSVSVFKPMPVGVWMWTFACGCLYGNIFLGLSIREHVSVDVSMSTHLWMSVWEHISVDVCMSAYACGCLYLNLCLLVSVC